MSDQNDDPASAPAADSGRIVVPETDRRRDPRADPSVIDLGSVQDADGDTDAGWARMVEDADPRPADDDARPDGADGDWTAVVAPELVEDDSDSGAPGTEPQVGREDYETLMEGEDEP